MKTKNQISIAAVLFLAMVSLFCASCNKSSSATSSTTDECVENPSSPNCTTPNNGTTTPDNSGESL